MSRNTTTFPPLSNIHSKDFLDYQAAVDLNRTTAPMKAIVETLVNGPAGVQGPVIVEVWRPEEFLGRGDDTVRKQVADPYMIMMEQQFVYTETATHTRQIVRGVASAWRSY